VIITNTGGSTPYNLLMRIIAGELKGREIVPPRGSRIRPATGRVREAVMSLFTPARLTSGPFLDFCAGSGLIGVEALSRGAPRAVFIEADARTAAHLVRTLKQLGISDRADVLKIDARRCFRVVHKLLDGTPAACAFLDPPFIGSLTAELLGYCGRNAAVLAADGLLIARGPGELPSEVPGLAFVSQRSIGGSHLVVYSPIAANQGKSEQGEQDGK
jgi:16S rRNA (guanine966-N2)-methyltransferase